MFSTRAEVLICQSRWSSESPFLLLLWSTVSLHWVYSSVYLYNMGGGGGEGRDGRVVYSPENKSEID